MKKKYLVVIGLKDRPIDQRCIVPVDVNGKETAIESTMEILNEVKECLSDVDMHIDITDISVHTICRIN